MTMKESHNPHHPRRHHKQVHHQVKRKRVSAKQAPEYLLTNIHIHDHFRSDMTYFECLCSMFEIHNETVNIWTHLLPAVFLSYLAFSEDGDDYLFGPSDPVRVKGVRPWVVSAFAFCASLCFFFSSVYHTFGRVALESIDRYHALSRLDFFGITILMASSFMSAISYGFLCHPPYDFAYVSIFGILSAGMAAMLLIPACCHNSFDFYRNILFFVLVISTIIPLAHWIVVTAGKERDLFFPQIATVYGLYGLGFVFFLSRFPECIWPGRFDILGHSHQSWHVLSALAAIYHCKLLFLYSEHWLPHNMCPVLEEMMQSMTI